MGMQTNTPQIPERLGEIGKDDITPPGVELFDLDDHSATRRRIFEGAMEELTKTFPKSYGGVRLELHNPHYVDPEFFTPREQRDAKLKGEYLSRRLRGTLRLVNEEDDSELDRKDVTLMRVPYWTDRGTILHNGSDYTVSNQLRMEPGIYSRRKANGELETQFNIKPGTGTNFRVRFEPDTMLYKVDVGGSSIKLYSLLKNLGIEDLDMRKRWGHTVFEANKAAYDERDTEKAYAKFARYRKEDGLTTTEKMDRIKEMLNTAKVNRGVVRSTLPTLLKRSTS